MPWYTRVFEGIGKPVDSKSEVLISDPSQTDNDEVVDFEDDIEIDSDISSDFNQDDPEVIDFDATMEAEELLEQMKTLSSPREVAQLANQIFTLQDISNNIKKEVEKVIDEKGINLKLVNDIIPKEAPSRDMNNNYQRRTRERENEFER